MRGTKLKVGNDARLRSDGFRSNESGLTADLKTSEERIFALTNPTFHQSIPITRQPRPVIWDQAPLRN